MSVAFSDRLLEQDDVIHLKVGPHTVTAAILLLQVVAVTESVRFLA